MAVSASWHICASAEQSLKLKLSNKSIVKHVIHFAKLVINLCKCKLWLLQHSGRCNNLLHKRWCNRLEQPLQDRVSGNCHKPLHRIYSIAWTVIIVSCFVHNADALQDVLNDAASCKCIFMIMTFSLYRTDLNDQSDGVIVHARTRSGVPSPIVNSMNLPGFPF